MISVSEAQAEVGLWCISHTLKFNFYIQDLLNGIGNETLYHAE